MKRTLTGILSKKNGGIDVEQKKEYSILAVGNSFTEDSFYYLHDLAKADGIQLHVVNLYIGGCSLKQHLENLENQSQNYLYEVNGESTNTYVSANQVLTERKWDFILTQQASHDSGIRETYYPYLEKVLAFFKDACPTAECLIQETWAYEIDSDHSEFGRYHHSQKEMYERLRECYREAADKLQVRLIPSGDVIQAVRGRSPFCYERGELSLCRDGFHMDMIYGRYLLAAVIYSFLFEKSPALNSFCPLGAVEENICVIKECVTDVLQQNGCCP